MTNYAVITHGPWRIRTSGMGEDKVAVSYVIDGKSEVVTVETRADLVLLRDAINVYLDAEAVAR